MSLLGARGEKVCSGHMTLNGQTDHHMVPTEQGPNNRATAPHCRLFQGGEICFILVSSSLVLGRKVKENDSICGKCHKSYSRGNYRIKMLQLKNLNTNSTSSTCMFLSKHGNVLFSLQINTWNKLIHTHFHPTLAKPYSFIKCKVN